MGVPEQWLLLALGAAGGAYMVVLAQMLADVVMSRRDARRAEAPKD